MILGMVLARAASQGLPNKNLRELGGKTLLDIAIDKALACPSITLVAVNTDIDVVQRATPGLVYVDRQPHLAGPAVDKWPVWCDTVETVENALLTPVTVAVDIDVSRPLTTVGDIEATLRDHQENAAHVTLATCQAKQNPYFDVYEHDPYGYLQPAKGCFGPLTCRQDAPRAWAHGGIVCVDGLQLCEEPDMWSAGVVGHEIDRSHTFDVDDALDWRILEALAA